MQEMYGLIGYPVAHSLSPVMMNTAFHTIGRAAHYAAFAVHPEDLEAALQGLWALGFAGANVTIPHKETVFQHVMEVSPEAKLAKAVNTLVRSEEGWIGHNTDVEGWWNSFAIGLKPKSSSVVSLLGAGGAARAVLTGLSLQTKGARVHLMARRLAQSERLALEFADYLDIHPVTWDERHEAIGQSNYVIQSTPLGMWPNVDVSCIQDETCFHPGQVVQDLVYRPLTTKLLTQAKARGCDLVDGARMLVGQGVKSFELWTGQSAPIEAMRSAVLVKL
jgi:shikimate dehydrogenase